MAELLRSTVLIVSAVVALLGLNALILRLAFRRDAAWRAIWRQS